MEGEANLQKELLVFSRAVKAYNFSSETTGVDFPKDKFRTPALLPFSLFNKSVKWEHWPGKCSSSPENQGQSCLDEELMGPGRVYKLTESRFGHAYRIREFPPLEQFVFN